MRTYGCIKSELIGNELDAANAIPKISIPDRYSLKNLEPIRDQGLIPKCMSVALTDTICWKLKSMGIKPDISDDVFWINRPNKNYRGMSAKDALSLLVDYHITKYTYTTYALVKDIESAKRCIIMNGPLMACIPVHGYLDDFWNGSDELGAHAVLLTGYNSRGFELRNSWGKSYGIGGYIEFPYDSFSKGFEYWTLIK